MTFSSGWFARFFPVHRLCKRIHLTQSGKLSFAEVDKISLANAPSIFSCNPTHNRLHFNWITNRSPDFQLVLLAEHFFPLLTHWTRLEMKISDAIMIFPQKFWLEFFGSFESELLNCLLRCHSFSFKISCTIANFTICQRFRNRNCHLFFLHLWTFYGFLLSQKRFSLMNWSTVFAHRPGKLLFESSIALLDTSARTFID